MCNNCAQALEERTIYFEVTYLTNGWYKPLAYMQHYIQYMEESINKRLTLNCVIMFSSPSSEYAVVLVVYLIICSQKSP